MKNAISSITVYNLQSERLKRKHGGNMSQTMTPDHELCAKLFITSALTAWQAFMMPWQLWAGATGMDALLASLIASGIDRWEEGQKF